MKSLLFAALAAGVAIPAFGLSLRYRRDLNAARARLAAVRRHVISTRWGTVEYAERGCGDPVLVVHGIFHNCVGGLLSVRDFPDRRFIAPSRFGYLGSSMPLDATPAHQAGGIAARSGWHLEDRALRLNTSGGSSRADLARLDADNPVTSGNFRRANLARRTRSFAIWRQAIGSGYALSLRSGTALAVLRRAPRSAPEAMRGALWKP
jgi:hypothetical protein